MSKEVSFAWDADKDALNKIKHGIPFVKAQQAFFDIRRIIVKDAGHSGPEDRFYCLGHVGDGIATVRFTWREGIIRIIGAGYWRKGKRIYERQNRIRAGTRGRLEGGR